MHRGPAEERIGAHAEAGGEFDLADDRLAIGHQRQRAVQPIDLGAGDIDAVELALERPGIGRQLDRHERAADRRSAACAASNLRDVEAEIGERRRASGARAIPSCPRAR